MPFPCRFSSLEERTDAFRKSDVYPVVTSDFCGGRDPLFVVRAVLDGGAKVIQIREKTMSDRDFFSLLLRVRALTTEYGALLIVDDRVDAALASGADGVHLGQDDFPVPEARKLAPDLLIGVSTHNREEIIQAQNDGCSYLNIGPLFPTKTKQLAMPFLGLEGLQALRPEVRVPFTVMGGIKYADLPSLKSRGAVHVAAVTAFTQADDPAAEVKRWRAALLA